MWELMRSWNSNGSFKIKRQKKDEDEKLKLKPTQTSFVDAGACLVSQSADYANKAAKIVEFLNSFFLIIYAINMNLFCKHILSFLCLH